MLKIMKLMSCMALLSLVILQELQAGFSKQNSGSLNSTIKIPEELNVPYSFENPPCKTFTVRERYQQIADGEWIMAEILAAEKAGKDEYVIPPGDYRFLQKPRAKCRMNGYAAFYLSNIKRPDDHPFTIVGNGVTFWTPPTEKGFGSAIYLHECDNVSIVGITVDSDMPNDIEGKLTAVDKDKNRIEIELLPGTITDEKKILNKNWPETRIIPFKANGKHLGELYSIDGGYGPGFTLIPKIEKSDKAGRYWLYFKNRGMVDVIDDPRWEEVFGAQGTWKTGDGVCLLYGAGGAFCLHNCKQVTMKDLTSHIAKFAIFELEGFGSHKWINVKLIRRPGTNQLLGSDGSLFQGMRNGSLYDGLVIGETTDDPVNIHGYLGNITAINPDRNVLTVNLHPEMFAPGEVLEFYNKYTGELLGRTKARSVIGSYIGIEGTLPGDRDAVIIRYPQYECANWVMRNCIFWSCYQCIVIQTGPGIFENNICRGMGGTLTLASNFTGPEGGALSDVTVRNNVFIDCGTSPALRAIYVLFWTKSASPIVLENIEISNNIIMNSGANAIVASETDGLVIKNNIIVNPLRVTALLQPAKIKGRQAVHVENARNVTVSGNYLVESSAVTAEDPRNGSKFVNSVSDPELLSGNNCLLDPENTIQAYIYKLLEKSGNKLDVKSMYEKTEDYIKKRKAGNQGAGL